MDCAHSGAKLSSPDYFRVAWASPDNSVFGAVSREADQVELVTKSGTHSKEVYSAPGDLGIPVKFFVVFGELAKGTELLVKGETGTVIASRTYPVY
jgi:hypothetical protein